MTSPEVVPASRLANGESVTTWPRLIPPTRIGDLAPHHARFGPLPYRGPALIPEVERAGLRGKGGAGFPTAVKMTAVAGRRGRRVVVANGTEGEAASGKDKALLVAVPHLVLDGAVAAAAAVGASEAIVCIERRAVAAAASVEAAIEERRRLRHDRVALRLELTPSHYVAGEESALVHWLNGGEAKPTFVPPRPFERGVKGRPTLVDNVETLAHIALIARHGAGWFRSLGTSEDPGTTLVTISGGVARPGVYEHPWGVTMPSVLAAAGGLDGDISALLVGGYFGTWIPVSRVADLKLGVASLRHEGASLGAGVIVALPSTVCGLAESARVARWLANETAGQCGPCVFGLEAIAHAMEELVTGGKTTGRRRQGSGPEADLRRWLAMVKGRGACKHPDGAARFVESALRVFADEIARHRGHGPCPASRYTVLPLPTGGAWR